MKDWCPYCDPKFFTIYGFCHNCRRRCEPPLWDPAGDEPILNHQDMVMKWNQQRSGLITDQIRRNER